MMTTSSKNSGDLDYYFDIFWNILYGTRLKQSLIATISDKNYSKNVLFG